MPPAPLATSSASCALPSASNNRRNRNRHQDEADVVLTHGPDHEPPEVPLLHRHVGAHLPTERACVERKCFVLVVHPELCVGDGDHGSSSGVRVEHERPYGSRPRAAFSKRAVCRPSVGGRHTAGNADQSRRPAGDDAAIVERCDAVHPSKARRERAEARQSDGHADLRDRAVGVAQQRRGPFESPGQEVLVRRLTERATEFAAEVRRRQRRGARHVGHGDRLEIARVRRDPSPAGDVGRAAAPWRQSRGSAGDAADDAAVEAVGDLTLQLVLVPHVPEVGMSGEDRPRSQREPLRVDRRIVDRDLQLGYGYGKLGRTAVVAVACGDSSPRARP